jgi:hypothetical protein
VEIRAKICLGFIDLKSVHWACISHRRYVRVWHSIETRNLWLHISFGELNEGTLVTDLIAIVRRREDRDQLAISFNLVTLVFNFV